MNPTTADLSDAIRHGPIAEPLFRDFGATRCPSMANGHFKVFEDNALVRTLLEEPGAGRVLVIDGGGSMRCALVGGNLAQLAVQEGGTDLSFSAAFETGRKFASYPSA